MARPLHHPSSSFSSSKNQLIISYQNARGELTKLYSDSLSLQSHLIVFTETCLKPDIPNFEDFSGMYAIYRHDRPFRRGGGDLIAVSSNLTSEVPQ